MKRTVQSFPGMCSRCNGSGLYIGMTRNKRQYAGTCFGCCGTGRRQPRGTVCKNIGKNTFLRSEEDDRQLKMF